jgi:hypothetical protein
LLEIFSFRVYGIGRKPAYTGRDWLYTLARDFEGEFNKLKVNLKREILGYLNDKSFKEKLASPYFYEDINPLDLRYLLWKYEDYLRTNEQPIAAEMSEGEFLNQNPKFKLTVEHIASQHPRVSTSVLRLPEIDDDFQENYLHRLGNLVFDPNSANASKGNNDIQVKNSRYFVRAPFKTQNELDNFIVNGEWSKDSIVKRGEKLMSFAISYWNPQVVYTEEIAESIQEFPVEEVTELKREYRELMKQIVQKVNKDFKVWNISRQPKKTREFKLYQTRAGDVTAFYSRWDYDGAKLYLEGGLWKEESEPLKCYMQIYTVKKSERLNFNINDPEIQEILQKEGFEKQDSIENKVDFLRTIELKGIDEGDLWELFSKEIQKIKPLIEKILEN